MTLTTPDEDLPTEKHPPPLNLSILGGGEAAGAVEVAAAVGAAGAVEVVSAVGAAGAAEAPNEVSKPLPSKRLSIEVAMKFKASRSWRRRFCKRFKLAKRRRTNCKSQSKEKRLNDILKWHLGYFKMLRGKPAGTQEPHSKWGRFLPTQRVNVDQTPLGFISGLQDTYEFKGSKETQPRLALIFRGKGLRITELEKASWDSRVDVYFQPNAWADREFCLDWAKRTYASWAKTVPSEKLLCMHGQPGWAADKGVPRGAEEETG
ncbi:hypothetical protein CYMTET_12935 [Cymbomonas tetramitiformis]|uniref:Uncharacterized protein n=1 Tax=Cymbomonas tetramitiformis TaxID=36881 RepID=A0AAE0GJC4_9CHLO|nr:hypothetical protein CYMTET_12935 [Cymbomonas tetramitiformis]